MENVTIASIVSEDGLQCCISATRTSSSGNSDFWITGMTDRAAREIKALTLAAFHARDIRLPGKRQN
jgi:hypothetical protein